VSNDDPYSEAAFKTLKYCPAFPERFGRIQDARAFRTRFFNYYRHEHRHSGVAHTPASVHYGTATAVAPSVRRPLPPRTPPTLPAPASPSLQAADGGLDQRPSLFPGASCSEGSITSCLKRLDKFRGEDMAEEDVAPRLDMTFVQLYAQPDTVQ